jgi:hypothetical protein
MSAKPPGHEPPDELDAEYRRLAAQDASAPSEAVRQAVHAYAARLAQERADAADAAHTRKRGTGRPLLSRGALFGTLAAAAIAGLVIAPRFLSLRTPESAPAATQGRTQVAAADAQRAPQGLVESERSASAPAESPPAPPERVAAAPPPAPELAKTAPPNVRVQTEPAPPSRALARVESAAPPTPADAEAKRETAAANSIPPQHIILSDEAPGASADRMFKVDPAAAANSGAPASPGNGLLAAAARGDLAGTRNSLAGGADVNARDGAGRTALLLATHGGHAEVVTLLLAAGADPNLADARGLRPLAAAEAGGHADIAAALRANGAR